MAFKLEALEKTVNMTERHEREEKELMVETMQMNNLCVKEGVK